jgi:hypothetical protein
MCKFLSFVFGFYILYSVFWGFCTAAELGFEAEDADVLVPIMAVFEDKTASEGKYISAGQAGGGREQGQAEYKIKILASGEYTIWGRVISLDTAKDSFHVTMDDAKSPQAADKDKIWDTGQHQTWEWSKITWREQNPLTFKLNRGEHNLIIWSREGDTRLDCIYMSTDANATPKLPKDVKVYPVEAQNNLATTWANLKIR